MHEHMSIGDFKAMTSLESLSFSQLYKGEFQNKQMQWSRNKQTWFLGQEANALKLHTHDPGAVGRRVLAMWYRRKYRLSVDSTVEAGMKEEAKLFLQ